MKRDDKQALDKYLARIELARSAGLSVNPYESLTDKMNEILRMKQDVKYLAEKVFPHICVCESADFQIDFANMVKENPVFKGYEEWGRGLAKSVWADIIIPFWLWINDENQFLCIASDTFDRACDLLDDLRAEFEANPVIIHYWGEQKQEGSWERGNFTTKSGFICKAFGARQKVRGLRKGKQRPTMWVIDDLETPQSIKNQKIQDGYTKWIERDVIPTMTGPHRRLIGANNRFAHRMVQTLLKERHPEWTFHHICAYNEVTYEPAWKAAYSAQFYRQQEKDMGIIAAHSEYNHKAILEGKIFNENQIQWGKLPPLEDFTMIIAHWDIAYSESETADFNAVKIWGLYKNQYWLIDCFVRRCKMRIAVNWMCDRQKTYSSVTRIYWQYEAQFWNDEVKRTIDESENENCIVLNLVKKDTPKINKLMRMVSGLQPKYQNARIFYNIDLKASNDCQEGNKQLVAVEPGSTEHDDSPDADEQATSSLEKYNQPVKKTTQPDEKSYRMGKMKQRYSW